MGAGAWPADWLTPQWPTPDAVRAVFTTRGLDDAEAASGQPWGRFNLGDHVGDDAAHVRANRDVLARRIGVRPVYLQQVHGTDVLAIDADTPDGATADATFTQARGVACTIMVADCLPVLITNRAGTQVAAAHAGWRGLAGGVLEQSCASFPAQVGTASRDAAINSEANELIAWLGPCIGPTAFEVGADVRDAFVRHDAQADAHFQPQPGGKFLADLPALARQRLAALGVRQIHGNDGSANWCTVTQDQRFHSYRRDQARRGGSGRMAACIWIA